MEGKARSPIICFVKEHFSAYFGRFKNYEPEQRAIMLLLLFALINLITSVIAVFTVGIYLLSRRDIAADIFRTGGNKLLFLFLALCFSISLVYLNIVGILACVFVFFLFVITLYLLQNISFTFLEDLITEFIGYSVIAAIYSFFEFLGGFASNIGNRVSSTFANPLYYSYFITFAVLFCTYRIVSVKKYRRLYVPVIILNAIGMILSGSRMPWVGMFVGLFAILILRRQYKLIFVFSVFIIGLAGLMMLFPNINIFAGMRLGKIDVSYEGRKPYWDIAIKGIFDKPLFGHGMIGMLDETMKGDKNSLMRFIQGGNLDEIFLNMKHHGWKMHAHNIALDSLFSYGIVGTLMLVVYGLKRSITFYRNCGYAAQNQYFSLICGLAISIGVNGLVDCEIVGLQTVVFSVLFVAITGLYAGENNADSFYKLEPMSSWYVKNQKIQ